MVFNSKKKIIEDEVILNWFYSVFIIFKLIGNFSYGFEIVYRAIS